MPLEELTDLKDRLHHFVKSAGPKESPASPRKNSEAGFLKLVASFDRRDSGETAGGHESRVCRKSPSLPTATSRPASAEPALTVIAPALGKCDLQRLRPLAVRALPITEATMRLKGCPKLRCETIRRGNSPAVLARTPNGKIRLN